MAKLFEHAEQEQQDYVDNLREINKELLAALELLVRTCPFKVIKGGIKVEISMEKLQVAQAAIKKAKEQ